VGSMSGVPGDNHHAALQRRSLSDLKGVNLEFEEKIKILISVCCVNRQAGVWQHLGAPLAHEFRASRKCVLLCGSCQAGQDYVA
jgi:hypothetical protein